MACGVRHIQPLIGHLSPFLQAQDEEAQRKRTAELAACTAAIQSLADMVGDPQDLWQAAVQLATTYTSASGEHLELHAISAHSSLQGLC
jgi:hypothetical protein